MTLRKIALFALIAILLPSSILSLNAAEEEYIPLGGTIICVQDKRFKTNCQIPFEASEKEMVEFGIKGICNGIVVSIGLQDIKEIRFLTPKCGYSALSCKGNVEILETNAHKPRIIHKAYLVSSKYILRRKNPLTEGNEFLKIPLSLVKKIVFDVP